MLDLSDPLWLKLDDAHRDRDIPALLKQLAQDWHEETATSLLYDNLCHQGTCYGATYAAIPHLLEMAQQTSDPMQRNDIAGFLGHVAMQAFDSEPCNDGSPSGLPSTLAAWDEKLDIFRSLVETLQKTDRQSSRYEQEVLLPRHLHVLAIDPVNEADLVKIEQIRQDFLASLGTIRALCERAFYENVDDEYAPLYFLSGMAAADGLPDLARLLQSGADGVLSCASCGWHYEYLLFDDRVAIYADDHEPGTTVGRSPADDAGLQDYRDGKPTRSDGFLSPISKTEDIADERIKALLVLANKAPSPTPAMLLRNFLGSFD